MNAMESLCGVEIRDPIRALRRLLYCGEWIESHALHVYMLHAPDFLGYESAVELARDAPAAVERGLALKRTGNEVMALVGGREVHPVNVRVGGVLPRADPARAEDARRPARARAGDGARDCALDGGLRLPRARGGVRARRRSPSRTRTRSRTAGSCPTEGSTSPRASTTSTSGRSTWRARTRCTRGARTGRPTCAARWPASRSAVTASRRARGRSPPRCWSVAATPSGASSSAASSSCTRATRRCGSSPSTRSPSGRPSRSSPSRASATACPRRRAGCCYHRYTIDGDGTILDAKIVPPTSQNQLAIEEDLRGVVGRYAELPDDELRDRCEQTIRNYDPCISCATHFLDLEVVRAVKAVVVGVGNAVRGDDAAGLAVAERVRGRAPEASTWSSASRSRRGSWTPGTGRIWRSWSTPPSRAPSREVCTASTRRRGRPVRACSVRRRTRSASATPSSWGACSGRLPDRVVVFGIEGAERARLGPERSGCARGGRRRRSVIDELEEAGCTNGR